MAGTAVDFSGMAQGSCSGPNDETSRMLIDLVVRSGRGAARCTRILVAIVADVLLGGLAAGSR